MNKPNILKLFYVVLFFFLNYYQGHCQYTTQGTGNWESYQQWAKLPIPSDDPFDGILSNGSYKISGNITRNGDIRQNVDLTVDGTLNVKGSFINSGGKLTISSGGVLRIFGDYSMTSNIEVKNGGVLLVYGNMNITGGSVDFKGDVIVGDNFKVNNSGATLYNQGNLVIGGNFVFLSGSFNIQGGANATGRNLYILDPNALITTPPWNNDVCNYNKSSCYYGGQNNFYNYESGNVKLVSFVNEVIFTGNSCQINIQSQPVNQTICIGNNTYFKIRCTGVSSYQWQISNGEGWTDLTNDATYNNVTTDSLIIRHGTSSLNLLRYRCIVKSQANCKIHSFSAVLTVLPKVAPEIISVTSNFKCGEGIVELKASPSAGNVNWHSQFSGGKILATGNSFNPSVAKTTTFYVDVTNNGCTSSVRVPVIAEIRPFPDKPQDIRGEKNVCQGAKHIYIVRSTRFAQSYIWTYSGSGVTLNIRDTVVEVQFSRIATSGTLMVKGLNDCGAGAPSEGFPVQVNALPVISIAGTTTLCQGQYTTLTATGGTSYAWSNGETTTSITVAPLTTSEYSVIASNAFGCTDTAHVTVTVNPKPVASITGTTTMCQGQHTTLTATGGTSYAWSNGETTTSITVAPLTTSEYSVIAGNAFGCIDTAHVTVTVNPKPVASITGTTTMCQGQHTTLTATGGTSYTWSNGETTTTIAVAPLTTSEYSVIAGNAFGCTDTAHVTVTVNPKPIASITGITTLCQGQNTTLTAGGGTNYAWSNGETTTAITVVPVTTTEYSVIAGNAFGCIDTAHVTVTVNPKPVASITGTTTMCQGQHTTLTAAGGTSYAWSNGKTTPAITEAPLTTTEYSVILGNTFGCTDTAHVTVTVNPKPVASITGTTTMCQGQHTTLTANGGTSYAWSNGETITAITVAPITASEYSVIAGNAFGCVDTAHVTVTVNPKPIASITGTTTLCQGQHTTLTATGGTSYAWSNGETTTAIIVNPTTSSGYSVVVSTTLGCSDTAKANVIVNPNPVGAITGAITIYKGQSTTLTASGGTKYLWNIGQSTPSIIVHPEANTEYSVIVKNDYGCSDTVKVSVTVNLKPTGSITGATTICRGQSTTLTASGGTTYVWNNGQTTPSITVNPSVNTEYTVIVKSSEGYSDTVKVVIKVNALPTAVISGTTDICRGQSTKLTGSGGISYVWSTGQTTPFITVTPYNSAGYSITITDTTGCSGTANVNVNVRLDINGVVKGPTTISIGQSATLIATGGTNYLWNTGAITPEITVTPLETTTYWNYITNEEGCADTAWITIYLTTTPIGVVNDNFSEAVIIPNPSNWTSKLMEYTTLGATSDGSRLSCTGKRPQNNVWFKFKATSRSISIVLTTDGVFGTIKNPVVSLYDAAANEMACQKSAGQTILKLSFSELNINKWYYVAIDNPSGMAGSFTLATNNNVNPGNIYYAIKDGDWNSNIWSLNPNALDGCGSVPSENDIVYVKNKHVTVSHTVKVYSVYVALGNQTSIIVSPGAKIDMKRRMYISND